MKLIRIFLVVFVLFSCKNKFQAEKESWMEHEFFCDKEALCEVFLADQESMSLLHDQEARQFFIDRLDPKFYREKENISEEFQTLGYLFYLSSSKLNVDSLLQVKGGYRIITSLLYNEVIPVDFLLPCRNLILGSKQVTSDMKAPANPIIPLAKHGYYEDVKFRFGLMNQKIAEQYSDYILSHLDEMEALDLDLHIFLHCNIGWPMSNEKFNRLADKLISLKPERKFAINQVRALRNALNTYGSSLPDSTVRFTNGLSTMGSTYNLFLKKVFNLCGLKMEEGKGPNLLDFEVTSYEMYRASMLDTKRIKTKKVTRNVNGYQETVEEQEQITNNGHEVISNNIVYIRFGTDTLLLPYNLNKPIDATKKDYDVKFFKDECWMMGISNRMFDIWIDESRKEYN